MSHRTSTPTQRTAFRQLLALTLFLALPVRAETDPKQVGRWERPREWPIVGIHAAMLPTGDVMHLSYMTENEQTGTVATVWNPRSGGFKDVTPGFGDMFCSGQNFLPDGKLFVAGGFRPENCPVQGTRETYTFDPFTLRWEETPPLRAARYYPTVLALADGSQLILAGQGDSCQYIPVMEMLEPSGSLTRVRGPQRIMRDYPRTFLLSSGEIAHVAPEAQTALLDPEMKAWTPIANTGIGRHRWEPTAFYVPGREDTVMLCGGYLERGPELELSEPTSSCEVIDFSAPTPVWRAAAPMRGARGDANAVILPDGKVLILGGGTHHRYDGPRLEAELYDPETDRWQVMAHQRYGRMYHSTALLLPDGRVLSAGQDDDGHGDGVVSGNWGEIFQPPYLFRGPRPRVRKVPKSLAYGESFELQVKKAHRIDKVVLIGLSAVTHATNVGQRYVPLEFSLKGRKKLRVDMEDNPHAAPPGHYMLFVVNDKGVPSVAPIVHLPAPAGSEA